jgi:hypothetical protein
MTVQANRRKTLGLIGAVCGGGAAQAVLRKFDVHDYGAVGDGKTLDTQAVQRAVDAAAAAGGGAQATLRAERKYLIGAVRLAGGIDFHLANKAEILVSRRPEDYGAPVSNTVSTGESASRDLFGVLYANGANDLTISGNGTINGRSWEFMTHFDAENEWWVPGTFRPKLLVLENCENLTIRDVTLKQAPSWTIHLVGCRHVLIEHIAIQNQLDVPNCDGIDPDHCQDVEIRDCHIVCGDDAIVIKTTAGHEAYGPSRNIKVRDCVLQTQDSGLKIGTETTQDIHDILFERCKIIEACRGLCIQLRDQGNIYNITYRDITFTARYFSSPWWGRGEAISFTAMPRAPGSALGSIHDILVRNVRGRAENSVRINGHATSRIRDIMFDKVEVTLDRWTKYPGGVFDNRPTTALESLEKHNTVGISVRKADRVTLKDCAIGWGKNVPDYFSHALEVQDVTLLTHAGFQGTGAHPAKDSAIAAG